MHIGKNVLSAITCSLAMAYPLSTWAATVTTTNTLYYSSVSKGDDIVVNTTEAGGIRPLQGYAVYLNGGSYYVNNVDLTTSGGSASSAESAADAIRLNGNGNSYFHATGVANIRATGDSADAVNVGAINNGGSSSFVYLQGAGGILESASGIVLRANNNAGEGTTATVVVGDDYTIRQTKAIRADNNYEGAGYAVYAGNRTNDIGGFGLLDWAWRGYRVNNKGTSYVAVGKNAEISSAATHGTVDKAAAVYANKGGVIQLGDNATITAPKEAYYLYAHTEWQNMGTNHAGETAGGGGGTILLNGGVTIKNDRILTDSQVVMLADGEGSVIKSGSRDILYGTNAGGDITSITFDDTVQPASGKFVVQGVLQASNGGEIDLSMSNGSYFQGSTVIDDTSSAYLDIDGAYSKWKLADDSSFTETTLTDSAVLDAGTRDFTLTGNVANSSGIVDLTGSREVSAVSNAGEFRILTINGGYSGGSKVYSSPDVDKSDAWSSESLPSGNGKLKVFTVWNNEKNLTAAGNTLTDSLSDLLVINGKVSGYTQVEASGGIVGNVEKSDTAGKFSADVVRVTDAANHQGNNFYGFADTPGAGQAILMSKDENNYAWYLPVKNKTIPPVDPVDPVDPVIPIRPEVPGYAVSPKANLELGYAMLGTLHERVGEQHTLAWDRCESCTEDKGRHQVWGKVFGKTLTDEGSRFGYKANMAGLKTGMDLSVRYNEDNHSRARTGVMLGYGTSNLKFKDKASVYFDEVTGSYRSKDAQAGTADGNYMLTLGGYNTYYTSGGSYLDLVGDLVFVRNKYESARTMKADNKGYGLILSAEAGKPFPIGRGELEPVWMVEPQVQLSYQHLKMKDFSDTVLDKFNRADLAIHQGGFDGLRGRLGVRIAYNGETEALKTKTFYGIANFYHDFIRAGAVRVGTDAVKERYNTTWGEIGIGGQLSLGKQTYLYGDARYEHSLGGSSGGKRYGYRGTAGVRYRW